MGLHEPNRDVAILMAPLFERGHEALCHYYASLHEYDRPAGTPEQAARQVKFVVTLADFADNALLCFNHVVDNSALIHILCADGAICGIFDKRTRK